MSAIEKAVLLIVAIGNERALGTKHYRQSTMDELHSAKDIIQAMSENDLLIKPAPERQHLFQED